MLVLLILSLRIPYVVDVIIEGNIPDESENYITHENTVNYGEYKAISDNVLPQQPLDQ